MVVYSAYCYKRLYGLSLKQIILKLLLFLLIGGVIYFGVLIAVTILMIVTGAIDFQQMVEAEKAKQGITYIASSVMNWTS